MGNKPAVLTINGGSSSIKFSVCELPSNPGRLPPKRLIGAIDRIGLDGTMLRAANENGESLDEFPIEASDRRSAGLILIQWLQKQLNGLQVAGIGHRIVHGGIHLLQHQLITEGVIHELKRAQLLDPTHLPREIELIKTFRDHFQGIPQVACLDTAFHHDLPRIASLLPIPRSFDDAGIRRFGFHGLSYTYLLAELRRLTTDETANGRVILAHLGSGASMAAVKAGKSIDTSMAFTPAAGLVMGTRPGDLDPGLLVYLMRSEGMSADAMDDFVNSRCGLLGVSATSSDMRDLQVRSKDDVRASEAIDLFCYQAKKTIGAYAAALGGLDTLVFSGGIGERSPDVRFRICQGLDFLGILLDSARNAANEPVVSVDGSPATVRVIPTDEEAIIARIVADLLKTS